MNGRTAKRLRRAARKLTPGKPKVAYVVRKNANGMLTGLVNPASERGVYKRFKAGHRGRTHG